MKRIISSALVIAVVAGCGPKAGDHATAGQAGDVDCQTAIGNAGRYDATPPTDGEVARAVALCEEQAWTAEARTCIATATSRAGVEECAIAAGLVKRPRTEAELNLGALGKEAQVVYIERSSFPVATVGLTPATPCCDGPGHQCPVAASDWTGAPWDELAFEQNRPFGFQYAYASVDGQTFEARAVGDLDCDGIAVTYLLRGRLVDGAPTVELIPPTDAD